MSILNNSLLLGADAGAAGYQISRSLRFNSADSAFLSRTPASAGNRKTWTWSGWVKRSGLGSGTQSPFSSSDGTSATTAVYFGVHSTSGLADALTFFTDRTGVWVLTTAAVFRDTSAWYHIVISVDTTQATSTNRVKIYVNGAEQALSGTYPTQDFETEINRASFTHSLGRHVSAGWYFSGYLADIHFIDGQALTPSSFAETNVTTDQWVPKAYTGSYGTNGFQLKFADNSNNTAATLGKDTSGNGNNWTPNNLSVTAGAGNDSLVDTPSSAGTDTGLGGQVTGNYATWNPNDKDGSVAYTNGNLEAAVTNGSANSAYGTFSLSSGKWYWEIVISGGNGSSSMIGVAEENKGTGRRWTAANGWYYYETGVLYNNISSTSYGASYTNGDVIGVALNMDNGSLVFYKNGTSQGTAYSVGTFSGKSIMPAIGNGGGATVTYTLNAGQRAFSYQAPSGFKALCDTNLPAPVVAKPSEVMDVLLWSGTGGNRSFSSLNMSPDFVWIKQRNAAFSTGHQLYDIVRGAGSDKELNSAGTAAEGAGNIDQYGWLSSFDSNGFSVTAGPIGADYVNASGTTYVAWTWDAGSSTVTNTQGSITSSCRTNQSSGFSVITYSGNGSTGSVGHGLNVAPQFIVYKIRNGSSSWQVYHASLGATKYLNLDTTDAVQTSNTRWNDTAPSSTVVSLGTNGANSFNYVMYAWAPVAGYSSFGSYVGNGSTDGPFVFCNFRPRWIMIKHYSGSISSQSNAYWEIYDTQRDTYNAAVNRLEANLSNAESQVSPSLDILSNGFKLKATGDSLNYSGGNYLYVAFAESPFQYARAR